ncbi:hypothetical protein KIH86_19705 [Paenibacillus sp. HN-1]|uniref:hypothetical protein n=1 Tax=Paenibacillus sp. CGMCC 1.18879 TaxID=2834466 RepID=UPI001CAA0ADE|nr:hypothetical protein [Paenibacillus sp. CGMCC 1.18879]MBY9082186.1 hypothetical protein [Paenibacillus sp. CGMCC 1.18879]MBY9086436.1 hypothetical protein [Paenibacillus sinensis]
MSASVPAFRWRGRLGHALAAQRAAAPADRRRCSTGPSLFASRIRGRSRQDGSAAASLGAVTCGSFGSPQVLDRPEPVRFANALAGLGRMGPPPLRLARLSAAPSGRRRGLGRPKPVRCANSLAGLALEPGRLNRGARLLCCASYDSGGGATKRKIGTGEAIAFAFIVGFQPPGGSIRKSNYNSDRKSKLSAQVAALIGISPPTT